jgi:hypothetical protein
VAWKTCIKERNRLVKDWCSGNNKIGTYTHFEKKVINTIDLIS